MATEAVTPTTQPDMACRATAAAIDHVVNAPRLELEKLTLDLLAVCKLALVMLRGAESGMNAPGLLTDLPAYKFIADTVARAEGGAL